MKKGLLVAVIGIALIVGFFIGKKFSGTTQSPNVNQGNLHEDYPLLAKRIFLENPSDVIINFTKLREQLRGYVRGAKPVKIGIYFEYLFTGQSVGIEDRDIFYVASLPKVPMAMEALRQIEEGKIRPQEELTLKKEHLDNAYGDLWKKGIGSKISVEEAIELSVKDSDNTAYKVLKDRVGDEDLSTLYDYLDIPLDNTEEGRGISPRNYSSILKSLFFSSYLSYENSEKLLELMAKPTEMDALSKGVHSDIKISNKFGIYKVYDNEKSQVYSDCGIVYVPERRYLLCVMVKGADVPDGAGQNIADISKIVYDYVVTINAPTPTNRN